MSNLTAPAIARIGCSDSPQTGTIQEHTLIIHVSDRPGSVDRVVGVLRRRRASMQTLVLGRTTRPELIRVTVVVNDSEVTVENLAEQLRRIVDVRQVENLSAQQTVSRELALIQISNTAEKYNEVSETAQRFGARAVDTTSDTITFEIVGSAEDVENFISALQPYTIREIARSGRIAMARGAK